MEKLNNMYQGALNNPHQFKSIDINEHLEKLKDYALKCDHVTEMGVRWGASTLAFIQAKPKELISYDIQSTPEIEEILRESTKELNHKYILGDTLSIEIAETDLLFIDTLHTYNQLLTELNLHEKNVKKFIILHDTTTFGRINETIYSHASDKIKNETVTKLGLRTAMEDFLESNKNWSIHEDLTYNNGLTILKRNV